MYGCKRCHNNIWCKASGCIMVKLKQGCIKNMVKILDMDKVKSAARSFGTVAAVTALSACSIEDMQNFDFTTVFSPDAITSSSPVLEAPRTPSSIVVCRSKQCSPASANMSKEFLFNAYLNLLENNKDTNVLMCDADVLPIPAMNHL